MNQQTNNTYKIKLTTITPVAIGDGNVLSPLSDYIYEGEKIYLVNHKKFEKQLKAELEKGNENIIDEFVKSVNNNDSLKDFIDEKLNIDFEDVCAEMPFPAFGMEQSNEIKACIKNGNQPYISGSTIKGAIKGALLYDLLIEERENKPLRAEKFSQNILQLNTLKGFYEEFDFLENHLFGENQNQQKNFSLFKVRDSELMNMSNLAFYSVQRVYLEKNGSKSIKSKSESATQSFASVKGFEQLLKMQEQQNTEKNDVNKESNIDINSTSSLETIDKENETTFEILISKSIKVGKKNLDTIDNELDFLQGEKAIESLFKRINNFYITLLKQEIEDIPQNKKKDFAGYRNFLLQQKELVEKAIEDNKHCYLRIGLGKTYFYNSIGLAIKQNNENAFEHLRKIMKLRTSPKLYPKTRTLLAESQLPLGWVKLELEE